MSLSPSLHAASRDIDESLEDAVLIHEIAKAQLAVLESKLTPAEKKELSALREKLGALSYKFVKTKAFMSANAKMIMFEYPDIFVFAAVTRVTKTLFMIPVMTYLGYPGWGIILNSVPDVEVYDYFYYKVRQKMKRNKMKAVVGFDQSEIERAKANLLQELDAEMPLARLHVIKELGDGLVPILKNPPISSKDGATPQRWVSTKELEGVVGQDWARELMSLGLDQALFENAMLQKALTNPEFRSELAKRKGFVDGAFESDMLRFFVETESFIDQIRTQLELNSQPLLGKKLFTDPEFKKQWLASYRLKVEIIKQIDQIRNYQMTALGQHDKAKSTQDAVTVPWERYLKDKESVQGKLQAFKNIFPPSSKLNLYCVRFYL